MSKKLGYRIAFWALVAVIVVFSVFPFYYAIITSFRTGEGLYDSSLLLNTLNPQNYVDLLGNTDQPFLKLNIQKTV